MMLTVAVLLAGGATIWRGRVTNAPTASALRKALRASNRQAATLVATLAAAMAPAVRDSSSTRMALAVGIAAVYTLAVAILRSRWRTRARQEWETAAQRSLLRTLMPVAPITVLPVRQLREAAWCPVSEVA